MAPDIGLAERLKAAARRLRRQTSLYNLSGLLNPVFDLATGGNRRPVFYDIDCAAPALRGLDRAYDTILSEFSAVQSAYPRLPAYHTIDTDVIQSSGRHQRDRNWSVFMLHCFGRVPSAARRLCPRTLALLDEIPGLYQGFFSVLDPGKSIPAHRGPSRAYLRYHLGLIVPEVQPPRMRVKDETYVWRTRESVLFDDSWDHEIYNECPQTRAVLIVDVARPLPAPLRLIAGFMAQTARLHYAPRIIAAMEARTARPQAADLGPARLA